MIRSSSTTEGRCTRARKQSSPVIRSQVTISGMSRINAVTFSRPPGSGRMRIQAPMARPSASGETERFRRDLRAEAGNHAGVFKAAHPLGDSGRRQPDLARQGRRGDSRIGDQGLQNDAVDAVERIFEILFNHNLCL